MEQPSLDMLLVAMGNSSLTLDQLKDMLNQTEEDRNYEPSTQLALVIAFSVLILFGTVGNGLVCYVVFCNPGMRTPRNIFIINLAISDLTLCVFTQPFNIVKACMPGWKLGSFMCKFIPMISGTNVFVSTISITAIALDRFQVIVYPTKDSMKKFGGAVALLSIWIISLLMSSPLLIFNHMSPYAPMGIPLYDVCTENHQLHYERGVYSIISFIFQYMVPIFMLGAAHARICNKLKYRLLQKEKKHSSTQRRRSDRDAKRKRRTNLLLLMIAIVFACAWMPLNIFNIIADFNQDVLQSIDTKNIVFPVCHLLVLSSACSNPVIYGWLNDNFRREFLKVLRPKACVSTN